MSRKKPDVLPEGWYAVGRKSKRHYFVQQRSICDAKQQVSPREVLFGSRSSNYCNQCWTKYPRVEELI